MFTPPPSSVHPPLQAEDDCFVRWAESSSGHARIGGELKAMKSRAAAAVVSQVGMDLWNAWNRSTLHSPSCTQCVSLLLFV
jgi:hypothetical protein